MQYNIIEVANTHGGDFDYIKRLIHQFREYNIDFGIKFQPFSFNTIATPDFSWYEVYKQLYFNPAQWEEIIQLASETKDVWLDLFDLYGVEILINNLDKIAGIKLQVSVLFNETLINALSQINLLDKKLIINISALETETIRYFLQKLQATINPQEILLEVGFQAYPTSLDDTGLNKIKEIKEQFNCRLVFADHIDGSTDDSTLVPVIATFLGADVIEKHVMLERENTKYDHFSSLTPENYKVYIDKLEKYNNALNQPFINDREREYLQKSIMSPILKVGRPAGSLLRVTDFNFLRSNKTGLNIKDINNLQSSFHILQKSKIEGETIQKEDLKKASIATIIACRLKSSRLLQKALLKVGDLTSVEFCIANALKFENVHHTILATSTVEQDEDLKNYTYAPSVVFHRGDPDDVIQRYLDICEKLRIDVVVRVTADMPFIENEILQILLNEHFRSGADYTTARRAAVGTNLEIINVQALKVIKEHFPSADYSEYMTWYFVNNPEYFKLNFVELPDDLVRDYRLTLDYQEDLDMFNRIHAHFAGENYNLRQVYKYLDENPEVSSLNSHLTLKYKTDQSLINTLNEKTKISLLNQ